LTTYNLTYKPFGKYAILIEWPSKIDENILKDVINFKNKISKNNIKVLVDVINTYNSLTVLYNFTIKNIYSEILVLKAIYEASSVENSIKKYCWNIPVCYDQKFGIDLVEISASKKINVDEIIQRHSGVIYSVYFIGFLPGFLYLGGLDESLNFARKGKPRLLVEKGSVGIGGPQTGIYPQNSAGGWNIIGKSPISFFNRSNKEPCFAKSGDKIRFVPVGLNEFEQIKSRVNSGSYKMERKLLDA